MASNLLQKEEEYRKLNEELQKRNKKLMEEFDNVMKKQDNLLKETANNNTKLDYVKLIYKADGMNNKFHTGNRGTTALTPNQVKFFELPTKENCENQDNKLNPNCIPESVDQMGVKGMTHFYRAKIRTMQIDYDKVQLEFRNKCDEVRKSQKENTKLTEEKDKWFQAYNANKLQISKLENQITSLNSKCQSKENENTALRREIEQVKKELKTISLNVSGNEVKLNRALDENEKLKSALKTAKQDDKDIKETHRKEINDITAIVKRLEKQKTELLSGFKKQLQLIDNLKKQKVCLEAAKLAQVSENEFMKILDWKIDS